MALIPQLRLWLPAYPGFKLFAYIAGSTTKQNTYSDSALLTPNANPVVADSGGLLGSVYLDPALSYKFVVAPSTDTDPPTSPLYTQDNVTSANANALTVLSKVGNYAVASTDGGDVIVLADATLGSMTISLYTAVGNSGAKVRVVKTDSSANTVTIDPSGTQTWAGATTRVLGFQYQSTGGVSDGANWQEFAQANMGLSVSSTGVVDWTGRIRTTNVGPHAVGLAVSTASQWKIGGTHAPTGANAQDNVYELTTTVTLETNASAAGMYINPTFTEAGSGTHAIIAGIWIPQYVVTNAAAAVTMATGLYIANAPTASGATTWALHVAAGNAYVNGQIDLSGAAGGQISFPATQNASAGANVLDDYEEGTWTPVLGGSGGQSGQSYSSQIGTYVKVGQNVTLTCLVNLSAKGTITSQLQISGLPFAAGSGYATAAIEFSAMTTNWTYLAGRIDAGGSVVTVFGISAAGVSMGTLATGDVSNTTLMAFSVSYRAAA